MKKLRATYCLFTLGIFITAHFKHWDLQDQLFWAVISIFARFDFGEEVLK